MINLWFKYVFCSLILMNFEISQFYNFGPI